VCPHQPFCKSTETDALVLGTRANLSYLDALAKFHKQQGTNLTRWPYVDKKPLDLYRLKKAVEARGGFEKVCKLKKWAEIGRDLGYSGKIMSSLSTSLKNSYQKWLCPYEEYLRMAKPGVHQQLELEYGGPLTPSPVPTPIKRASAQSSSSADSSGKQAPDTDVNAKDKDRDVIMTDAPSTSNSTSGFTAINRPTGPSSSEDKSISASKSQGTSGVKRQLSCDSQDSSKRDSGDKDEGENGSRRSKRLKKGRFSFIPAVCAFDCLLTTQLQTPFLLLLGPTCLCSAHRCPEFPEMKQ